MRLISSAALAATLSVATSAGALAQSSVTLEPVQDGTLFENAMGARASGAGLQIIAGANNQGLARRLVMRFDVAGAVPAGATVTSASLRLRCDLAPPFTGPEAQSWHRLLQAWGEGASDAGSPGGMGAPSAPGDATWIHTFFPGSTWTSAGGDFVAAASATEAVGQPAFYTWTSAALAADVQDMLDQPTDNHGWLLKAVTESSQSARSYVSREAPNVSVRPILVVEFDAGMIGTSYCGPAAPNSTGGPASLTASGSVVAASNNLSLMATGVPPNQFGYLVAGPNQGFVMMPGTSQGNLCLASPIGRFTSLVQSSGAAGTLSFSVDLSAVPTPSGTTQITAGQTYNFQAWFRDANPTPTSNFTDGVEIAFQ